MVRLDGEGEVEVLRAREPSASSAEQGGGREATHKAPAPDNLDEPTQRLVRLAEVPALEERDALEPLERLEVRQQPRQDGVGQPGRLGRRAGDAAELEGAEPAPLVVGSLGQRLEEALERDRRERQARRHELLEAPLGKRV